MNPSILNPLDRNRYLYDQPTTRQPSCRSKASQLDFSKFAASLQQSQCNKQNIPWQDKKSLKQFGREITYKIVTETENTDEDDGSAQRVLLLMIENERLRVQLKAEEDRGRRDLEEVKREKERLEEKVRRGQHGEQEMREQLRLREIKIEETFESIKRLYERNNQLNSELAAARKELALNKSRGATELEVYNSRKEVNELKAKLLQLESQENTNRMKTAGQKEELAIRLQQAQQKLVRRQQQLTLQIQQLQDNNVSLKFEVSRLKAQINTKLTKQKEIHSDLCRTEEILRNKENQLKEESKRWFKKVQDIEVEKTTLLHNLLKHSQEKDAIVEQLRICNQNIKVKESQIQELNRSKDLEIENLKKKHKIIEEHHTSEMNSKAERISSLEYLLEKQRNSWNMQKQDLQKLISNCKKQIQELKQSIQVYQSEKTTNTSDQIIIAKLRAENGTLKDQISDQYKSILMFQNKVKAYQNRISVLQKFQQQHQTSTNTYIENNSSFDEGEARQASKRNEVYRRLGERERERARDKQRERKRERDWQRERYNSVDQINLNERKRLLHHYQSSSLLQHQVQRYDRDRLRYASRDRLQPQLSLPTSPIYSRPLLPQKIREQHINVSLPTRPGRLILHSDHQKQSLNDVIVRKCKILS